MCWDINKETNILSAHECTVETHKHVKHTHSINGCRQTHRDRQSVSVRRTGVCCAPLSRDNTQHDGGGTWNIPPPHTAITCRRSYILLDIESFSQLAPKNKQSSVCPCRWAGAATGGPTGVNRQPRKMFKPGGTHWKAAPFARSAGDVQGTRLAFSPSHFLLCWLRTVTVSVYMLPWLSARHGELPPSPLPLTSPLNKCEHANTYRGLSSVPRLRWHCELLYRALLKLIKLDFSTHSCKLTCLLG